MGDNFRGTSHHGAMSFARVRRSALILIAVAACRSDPASPSTNAYASAFDAMWNAFDAQYPYFDFKQVDWAAQRAAQRPRAESAQSLTDFLSVIRETVAPLRDAHVWLEEPSGTTDPIYEPPYFVNWDRNVWQEYVARSPYMQQKPNLGTSEFDGVPYLVVGGWTSQFTVDDLDAALERFRGRDRLILDVRSNGGGNDQLALALAARFTTTPVTGEYLQYRSGPRHSDLTAQQARTITPRGSWQFSGRVYLLVGRRCASSNESFISFLREMPSVTVVGDTTAGASGNPAPVTLTAGWKIWVPRWIARTAQHDVIEWNGIAPDILVPVTAADFASGRDPVLDFAIAALRGGG